MKRDKPNESSKKLRIKNKTKEQNETNLEALKDVLHATGVRHVYRMRATNKVKAQKPRKAFRCSLSARVATGGGYFRAKLAMFGVCGVRAKIVRFRSLSTFSATFLIVSWRQGILDE